MTSEQEKLLTEIHQLTLADDHMHVQYSENHLRMAQAVIQNMEKKLLRIADLIQVVCGD